MNATVDRLIAEEQAKRMLDCLSGEQLLILQLILCGWNGAQIAEHLGVSRSLVSQRLSAARRRILQAMPELAPAVDGRSRQRAAKHRSRKET